jgi:hypothetical protein
MAFSALGAAKRAYDDKKLREQITRIEETVDALGAQIHEVLLIDVRAAYRHLETASMAANDSFRREELMLARGVFARLVEHPVAAVAGENGLTSGQVVAIAHAGNYSYFLMKDEVRLALLEAYRCTERFPALGVQLFPAEIFSRDYSAVGQAMVARRAARDRVRAAHEVALKGHKQSKSEYYKEMAWKVPAAGAVFLGFLAAGAVAPPLAAQAPMRAAGILAGTGSRGVSDIPGRAPALHYGPNEIDPPEETELMRQASSESAGRRATLERSA